MAGVLLGAIALVTLVAPAARAADNGDGTYSIAACAGAGGVQELWQHSAPSAGMYTYSDCAASNSQGAVRVGSAVEPGSVGWLSNGEAHVRAAAGTTFLGASLTYGGYANTTFGWSSWIAATNDPGGSFSGDWGNANRRWIDGCTYGSWCAGFGGDNRYFDISGAKALQISSICATATCARGSTGWDPYSQAFLYVYSAGLWIRDDQDPALGGARGSITGGGWKRGDVDALIDVSDNTGVKKVAFAVDEVDNIIRDFTSECSYTRVVPCRDRPGEGFRLNTTGLKDGRHVWQIGARDASGRSVLGPKLPFFTDNHAPAAPTGLSIDGGEGWSPSNSRTIRWTNPDQGSGSPLAGAQVQVCKTGTSACRTADHGAGGVVGGVGGFDGPGDYTVRVALRDEAGNFDSAEVSNGVHLRFDDVAPGLALPAQSNGWLNAVERAAFQQSVRLPTGEFKPVSGIQGYSISTDGNDPDGTVEALGETVDYPMGSLPEGQNAIKVRAVSNAGVGSPGVSTVTVRVDLSKPTASVDGAPDAAGWQNQSVDLMLRGTDQPNLSGMTASSPTQGIEDGAYIAYKIDGGELQKVRGGRAPISVSDEGEHTVTYYAVDFAGNQSDTETVQFKIDRSCPTANAVADSVDPEQWQRESVTVTLTGDDGLGGAGMDPASSDQPIEDGAHLAYRLNTANVQKVRGGTASFRVDADGDHTVTYYAVDAAGNQSEGKEVRFRIDKTAPGQVVLEDPGADRRRIEVAANDATSGIGEVQIGIRRVGSIADGQRLRRLARKDPSRYRRTELRSTRRTGNRLRNCRDKRGAARRRCREQRRRQIGLHRIAGLGEDWRMLPAARAGENWVATVPNDQSLVEGVYQLVAVAQDQAGNESSGDRFRGGQPAIIPISDREQRNCCTPDRGGNGSSIGLDGNSPSDLGPDPGTIDTKIAAGAVQRVRVPVKIPKRCKKPKTAAQKKKCKRARKPRYREQFVSRITVKFGGKANIKGSLTTVAGAPIADGAIDVIATPNAAGHVPQIVGAVTSDANGGFAYTAPAGSSRTVTFRFRGRGDYRRSAGDVTVLVPASATLKSNKTRVANGQSVTFTGKVLGKPLPDRGKVVDLQAFYRGKWRTFATPRANKKGQFKFRYRFEATRTTTTYKFRARLRAESAYAYELGYSKVISVRVSGG